MQIITHTCQLNRLKDENKKDNKCTEKKKDLKKNPSPLHNKSPEKTRDTSNIPQPDNDNL